MTGINRTSLRVLGINVAKCGVANLPGLKAVPSMGQAPTYYLSWTRHLTYSDAGADTAPQQERSISEPAAERAGRLQDSAGVSRRRRSARFAGQAIPLGWPNFTRAKAMAADGDPGKVIRLRRPNSMPSRQFPFTPQPTSAVVHEQWCHRLGRSCLAGSLSATLTPTVGLLGSAARGK
jgi:hypothetical protein